MFDHNADAQEAPGLRVDWMYNAEVERLLRHNLAGVHLDPWE